MASERLMMAAVNAANAKIHVPTMNVQLTANVRSITLIKVDNRLHHARNSKNLVNVQELSNTMQDATQLSAMTTPIVVEKINVVKQDARRSVWSRFSRFSRHLIIHVSHSVRFKLQLLTMSPKKTCVQSLVRVASQRFDASQLASHLLQSYGNEAESRCASNHNSSGIFIKCNNIYLCYHHNSSKQIRDALCCRRVAICKLFSFIEQMLEHMFVSHTMASVIALSARCI